MSSVGELFTGLLANLFSLERWPFISAMLVMTIVGQFTSTKVFTRVRAYHAPSARWFWMWGRETLPLHPLATGCVLGLLWRDPEGAGWPLIASCMYFATAGVCSLFVWIALRTWAKRHDVDLRLPGHSMRPTVPFPSSTYPLEDPKPPSKGVE